MLHMRRRRGTAVSPQGGDPNPKTSKSELMRSVFPVIAIVILLLVGWYSNFAVMIGLRSGGGVTLPKEAIAAIVVGVLLLARRRTSVKSVTH